MHNPLRHQVFFSICLATSIACSDDQAPGNTSGLGGTGDSESGDSGAGESESEDSGAEDSGSEDSESTDTGTEGPSCEPQDPVAECIDDDVYQVNGCDEPMLVDECEFGCSDGACQPNPCLPKLASSACHAGNIWWFDNCGTRVVIKEACDFDCEDGQCVPPPPAP
jgi:hypothetical protein